MFRHHNRKLLESYAKRHALAISLGTVLSFMAVKVGGCPEDSQTNSIREPGLEGRALPCVS